MPANDPLTRALDDGAIPFRVVNGRAVVDPEHLEALHRSALNPKGSIPMSTANYSTPYMTATVAPNVYFSYMVNGDLMQFIGGDTVSVATKDYPDLKLRGILL